MNSKNPNKDVLNKAIPDNIDDFITWLHSQGINYHSFTMSSNQYKVKKLREFIKLHPEILQYRLFD